MRGAASTDELVAGGRSHAGMVATGTKAPVRPAIDAGTRGPLSYQRAQRPFPRRPVSRET